MTATATIQSSLSINRNIVECKVVSCETNPLESLVLIETLWNVKRHPPSQDHGEMSINRNIVECKGFSNLSISLSSVCINRNIVECKEKV